MGRIVVVANCQSLPLARTLALGLESHECEFIDINFLDREPFVSRVSALKAQPAEFVLSIPLSDKWSALSDSSMSEIYQSRFLTFTNIHFAGLHPDITYLGQIGSRVQGYLTDYHSKIVLYSFASGRSQEECQILFSEKTYSAVNYMDAFEIAADELRKRDDDCKVKFANTMIDMVRNINCLYTINHPTDAMLQELCKMLCGIINIPYIKYPSEYLTNSLSDNVIWPIYNPIAEHHRLPYRTPQTFVSRNTFTSRTSSLSTMINRFYSIYQTIPGNEIRAAITAMPFYTKFAERLG